ncbi:MAG: DUF4129 domain-containing protein [Asgard group archaeon]|nr:DUF4129 domain-containing protein [Asgard group archaeon]
MAFTLTTALKSSYHKLFGILIPIFIIILVIPLTDVSDSVPDNYAENVSGKLTADISMEIISEDSQRIKSQLPETQEKYQTKSVSPTTIIRGDYFTVEGVLLDNDTGLGITGQSIYIFWEYYDEDEFFADPSIFIELYLIGQGTTNGTGHFTISSRDSTYSKSIGSGINVYAVFLALGTAYSPRYTSDTINCYAHSFIGAQVSETTVREGDSFYVVAAVFMDNWTIDYLPIADSIGEDITIEWLGSTYQETITVFGGINRTLNVPISTPVGVYHELKLSFNISILNLPYIVGNQVTASQIGTPADDWCNYSTSIWVYTGAGVTLDIDSPPAPGIGSYPEILRNVTPIVISGTLTNSTGGSFNDTITLEVFFDATNIKDIVTELSGDFSTSFIINSSSYKVGIHEISVDVEAGQGITATIEYENVTIVSNSTLSANSVNATAFLSGEVVRVSGTIRDEYYTPDGVSSMDLIGQWEDFGSISGTTTDGSGNFAIDIMIPLTINPALENGTIYLYASDNQYYTGSNATYVVDVFSNVDFTIALNQSEILEGARISSIGGSTLYTNSYLTIYLNLTDQFSRPLANRDLSYNITDVIEIPDTTDANGLASLIIDGTTYGITAGIYSITITVLDNPSSSFSFELEFVDEPQPTTEPSPTPSNGTTPGGIELSGKIAIGVLVSIMALIVIIAVIYGFGRFRRKDKIDPGAAGLELLDFNSIMKLMADAERAKDYQRAVVLCYQAFALLCVEKLGIFNARSSSPRELARIVASTNRIPVRDITMLVMRFEEAQYSNHKISKNAYNLAKQAFENAQLALKSEPKNPK